MTPDDARGTDAFLALQCCASARRLVRLAHPAASDPFGDHETRSQYLRAVTASPPSWTLRAIDRDAELTTIAAIRFCPFCGRAVPALRLRAHPPDRIRVYVGGESDCDTCGRDASRFGDCACAPPELLWEPDPASDAKDARPDERPDGSSDEPNEDSTSAEKMRSDAARRRGPT